MSFTAMRIKCRQCGTEFWAYPDRKGSSGKYPKFCSRGCYTKARAAETKLRDWQADEGIVIRVPAKFYDDHEERECEPFCTPVKRTSRFVWLRHSDPGLPELLSDARHYSDEWGPDEIGDGGGLKKSAAATVKAIEASAAFARRNGGAA